MITLLFGQPSASHDSESLGASMPLSVAQSWAIRAAVADYEPKAQACFRYYQSILSDDDYNVDRSMQLEDLFLEAKNRLIDVILGTGQATEPFDWPEHATFVLRSVVVDGTVYAVAKCNGRSSDPTLVVTAPALAVGV